MTIRFLSGIILISIFILGKAHPSCAAGQLDYTSGLRLVKEAVAAENFPQAERYLVQLARRYPRNAELTAMQARVLLWQKQYARSVATYRRALALKKDANLERELQKAVIAMQLADAERLLKNKEDDRAEKLLRKLFDTNQERYESGLRLARLYLASGRNDQAAVILEQLLKAYPSQLDFMLLYAQALLARGDTERLHAFLSNTAVAATNAELLAIRGRAYFRTNRFAEAVDCFTRSLSIADNQDMRLELERARNSDELGTANRLAAEGRYKDAAALLYPLFNSGRARYDAGIRLAGICTRTGDAKEAARIYKILMQEYPDQRELLLLYAKSLVNLGQSDQALEILDGAHDGDDSGVFALRGRIFFLRRQLDRAHDEYARALKLTNAPDVIAESKEVEAALRLEQARSLVGAGQYRLAEPLLRSMPEQGYYPYESRLLLGRTLLAGREYQRAADHYCMLRQDYPTDSDVAAGCIESLILSGKRDQAGDILYGLNQQIQEGLKKDHEDLYYRVNANWLKLFGGAYGYSGSYGSEHTAGATVSQNYKRYTFVTTAAEVTRFGVTEPLLGLEMYVGREDHSTYWGMLSFSTSPGARILPVTTAGGELSRGVGNVELSLGYNRLDYRNGGANVIRAGLLWYIPASTLSLGEKVYVSPEHGTAMPVTTLYWEPDHHYKSFIAIGAGTSSEKTYDQYLSNAAGLSTLSDKTFFAWSVRVGAEYRFSEHYSLGAEGSFESLQGLYDRSGGLAYLRYWWR